MRIDYEVDRLEQIGGVTLNLNYWDCECDDYFIHRRSKRYCANCRTHRDDPNAPHSRQEEIMLFRKLGKIR